MRRSTWLVGVSLLLAGVFLSISEAAAQAPAATAAGAAPTPPPPPMPYGPSIKLEAALKVLAAAKAEADANQWPVAISIVDTGGHLVAFHRLDETQIGSVNISLEKAKTAALFRRSTKVFEDLIAGGGAGLRVLKLPGALPVEGGLPIVVDGKVVGGIGVSGVTSQQDAQVATAGLTALAKP